MKKIGFILDIEGGDRSIATITRLELELDKVNKQIREAKKEGKPFDGLKADQVDIRNQLKLTNKEIRDMTRNFQNQSFPDGSIVKLEQRYSNLRTGIRALSKTERESDFGKRMIANSRILKDEIREVSEAFGDTTPNIGNYEESIKRVLSGQSSLTGEVGGLLKSLGPAAVFGALSVGGAKLIQLIGDTTQQFIRLRGEVANLTQLYGVELDSLTVGVQAISETFKQPFDQVLVAANALTQQLTGDFQESLRLIEQGFLTGANGSDEFLDILREYPTFFEEAGFSGQEFINIINSQVQQGIFSDKGVDTIKEANERLRDLRGTALDGLEAIGLTGEQVTKVIAEDGIAGAIALVSGEISKLAPESREAFLAIDGIFGSPGLDAGFSFISSLKEINSEIPIVTSNLTDLQVAQQQQLEQEKKLADAQNRLSRNFSSFSTELSTASVGLRAYGFEILNQITNTLRFGQVGALVFDSLQKAQENNAKRGAEINASIVKNGEEAFRESRKLLFLPDAEIERQVQEIFGGATGSGGGIDKVKETTKTFEELKREQTELKKTISNLRVEGKDYTDELVRYNEVTKQVTGVNNIFNKSVEKTKEIFADGSLAAISAEVAAIQKEVNEAPESDLPALLQRLVAESEQLDLAKERIQNLRGALEDDTAPTQALAPLETLAPGEVTQTDSSIEQSEIDKIEDRKNRLILAAAETAAGIKDIEDAQAQFNINKNVLELEAEGEKLRVQLENAELAAAERLRIETELAENILNLKESQSEKEKIISSTKESSIKEDAKSTAEAVVKGAEELSKNFEKFLSGQESLERAFLKASFASFLTAIENQINLSLVAIITKQIESKGFIGLATGAALAAVVKGAFAVAKSKIKGFAEGGKIEGINIPTRDNGDNVLITARTGEVVLNEDQQAAIKQLSGTNDIFSLAQVPGFNDGGLIGGGSIAPQLVNPNVVASQERQAVYAKEAREEARKMNKDFIDQFEEAQNRAADRLADLLEAATERGTGKGVRDSNLQNERLNAFNTQNNIL